jgi:hypothetical protein
MYNRIIVSGGDRLKEKCEYVVEKEPKIPAIGDSIEHKIRASLILSSDDMIISARNVSDVVKEEVCVPVESYRRTSAIRGPLLFFIKPVADGRILF